MSDIDVGTAVEKMAAAFNLMAEQVHAMFLVNTALVTALRDRGDFDIALLHSTILERFPDEQRNGNVVATINAMLIAPAPAVPPAALGAAAKEAARARFRVIEGSRPDLAG